MRVLLVGQKIVTLNDLETYFHDHFLDGSVCLGTPAYFSLDIVEHCNVGLIIGQTTDYPLAQLVSFLEKAKTIHPQIQTLLIVEPNQYRNLSDRDLMFVDDFLTPPFSPGEFHVRMMKIYKRNSTHPDVSTQSSNEDNWSNHKSAQADGYIPASILNATLFSEATFKKSQNPSTTSEHKVSTMSIYNNNSNDSLEFDNSSETTNANTSDEYLSEPDLTLEQNPIQEQVLEPSIPEKSVQTPSLQVESVPLTNVLTDQEDLNASSPLEVDLKGFVVSEEYSEVIKSSGDKKLFDSVMQFIGKTTYIFLILFLVSLSVFLIKSKIDGGIATFGQYAAYAQVGAFSVDSESAELGSLIFTKDLTPEFPTGKTRLLMIPFLGYLVDFARTQIGVMVVIILPSLLILSFELYYFFKFR